MSRKKWMIVLVIGVLVLAAGGGAAFLFLGSKQTISSATSPDGSWFVAVIATPHLISGSYDIVIVQGDGQGKMLPGGMVVGLESDLAKAGTRHAVTFVDNNTAKVGSRIVERPASLRK
jgi:hypothetical protein